MPTPEALAAELSSPEASRRGVDAVEGAVGAQGLVNG